MPAKFIVKKGSTGKFRFNLLSTNGQVVATSESYESKAAAMGGIRSVQRLASDAVVEDRTTAAWAKQQAELKASSAAAKRNGAKRPVRKPATKKN